MTAALSPAPRTVLVIDNYDSFTFNLVQLLRAVDDTITVRVVLNDRHTASELLSQNPWRVVISPGPGSPRDAGVSNEVLSRATVPVLGVCLGHQCIAEVFGASVIESGAPVHGKPATIRHTGTGLFRGVPLGFTAARYHSLYVDPATVPACLEVTAWTDDGVVMGLAHRTRALVGVQFHPESVLTTEGEKLVRNFLAE